jgi:predicted enzyme related to lactoylglutathione lyase
MPTFANGKICYLEIPALDVAQSSAFYHDVFEWKLRPQDDGSVSFDDGVEEVSGTWVLDGEPMTEPGIIIWIMVPDAQAAADRVLGHGGTIVLPVDPNSAEKMARFRDPAGNQLGIYQQDNA